MKKYVLKIDDKVYNVDVDVNDDIADVSVNGNKYNVLIESIIDDNNPTPVVKKKVVTTAEQPKSEPVVEAKSSDGAKEMITSPLPGNVLKVEVEPNSKVKRGDILIIIEAMKMENNILAPHDGVVEKVFVKVGDVVMLGDELVSLGK